MDYFSRLILRCVFQVFLALPFAAHAFLCSPIYVGSVGNGASGMKVPDLTVSSGNMLCQTVNANYLAAGGSSWVVSGTTSAAGQCGQWVGNTFTMKPEHVAIQRAYNTGSGGYSTTQGSNCTENGNSCAVAGTVIAGSNEHTALTYAGSYPSSTTCLAGCTVKTLGTQICADGACYNFGPYQITGSECSGSSVPTSGPSSPSPSASNASQSAAGCAAKGLSSGTVNGQVTCVPSGSVTTIKSTSTAASGVGTSATGTQTSTGTTSSSGTSSTTCTGNTCVTSGTSTTVGADGSSNTTGTSKTQDKGTFCTENPKDVQCKDSGSFGGSCGAFSCDGDAVQCAIAKEQYQRNCKLFDDQTELSQSGTEIANGQTQPSGHPGASPDVRAWNSSFDTTNAFGNSCPSDFAFNALGHSVNVPISGACDVLRVMGYAALAFTYLAAAKLVFGGFAGGGA